MYIKICKWKNNANSPLLFFIDDLANVWVDLNGNGKIDLGEDWGYGKNSINSSFRFLNENLLDKYDKIKTTFFVPVGVRVGMIANPKIKSISKDINCDEETKEFFRNIQENSRYEIAYHGTNHGKVGETAKDFKQEWEMFGSLYEAISTINKGKEIYKEVFNSYPKGGKYPGYTSNEFSDESIDITGFLWWCRYCNLCKREVFNTEIDNEYIYGTDTGKSNFDIKFFGKNNVIDIPSTLHGGIFNRIISDNSKNIIKRISKKLLKKYLMKIKNREMKFLLENKLVISIQEHISPARDDGKEQNPNIFTDLESLKMIFQYFKDKNVWYCTGTELAEYIYNRENTNIEILSENTFELKYSSDLRVSNCNVTLKVDNKFEKVKLPNGEIINVNNRIVDIPIINGKYFLL